ncbi:MAG TPA: DNA polymerase I [Gemmatimonadales bacterium]
MTVTSERLFLVDGYALIYRAFYAMISRPLTTSRGENTSATWGVANFLLRLLREHQPPYLAWVHDAGTSFRHVTYPEYKATREKLEPELQEVFDQSVQRVTQLLAAFHVPLIVQEGYEADDVIGTLATAAGQVPLAVVIVSGDKDFYQLIDARVSVLNPGRGGPAAVDEQWIDPSNATDRLGVPPERVVDYLALVGDASDNVPGVKGVGAKTAVKLIAEFGGLEDILARAGEVSAKRAREALLRDGENARLSRDLVTIRRDVPMAVPFDELRAVPPDHAALAALFAELEFHSLIPQLAGLPTALLPRSAPAAPTGAATPAPHAEIVTTVDAIPGMVAALRAERFVAIRVETGHTSAARSRVIGLAFATSGGGRWYLPCAHRAPAELGALEPENLPPFTAAAMQPLVEFLGDPDARKVAHDAKQSWLALMNAHVPFAGLVHDTMLASFVLDPGRRSHDLSVLAVERLGAPVREYADLIGKGRDVRSFDEIAVADAARFACERLAVVLRLHDTLEAELDRLGLRRLLDDLELPLVPVLVAMERIGVSVDVERLAELSREFGHELAALEQRIHAEAGTDFNINSTPQLRHVLFEKLQLPIIKKTKTGASTDADVLAQLAEMGYPTPQLLLEYRELTKLRSTYVDVLPQRVDPATGRIHTTFNQTGAATGRLSSLDPNLQNIPIRTRRGEEIRRCFVPGPGRRLVVADYSQIELRILAHLSGDAAFIAAFERGGDIHRETAAIIFEVEPANVTPEMRGRAKTINFATIYGQGPFALSKQLGIAQDEAKRFIDTYFERFAGVRRFLDETVARARDLGYVETVFGRRRYIPELREKNRNVRAFGERTAMNSPMQGSAADLIKRAMIRLHAELTARDSETALLLQVHDELVLESPASELDAVRVLVKEAMEGAAALRVPLVADVGIGDNWMDAKA